MADNYAPTKDHIVSWLMEGAYTGQGADQRAEAFDAWLAEHDAALIEELAAEWEALVQREMPPKRGSLWLREKARQRREEQDR